MTDLILRKREGLRISDAEFQSMIADYVAGQIPDYQMSAWLMAVYFRGMDETEILAFTRAMWQSGESLSKTKMWDDVVGTAPRPEVDAEFWIDKHSTGGVGDKTSMLLVPWVASTCRRLHTDGTIPSRTRIPMISGRGLGFTGGTLDKLESVPGFCADLSLPEAYRLLQRHGFFIIGQTKDLAPADRRIYALRDVTATVESIPLITASILSKKFSSGLDALVLDIKVGQGSFMSTIERARTLADTLIGVCRANQVRAIAVLTRMDEPLGSTIGHRIEIEECREFFVSGQRDAGLYRVTLELASQMVWLAARGALSLEAASLALVKDLQTPGPLAVFDEMIAAQSGDLEAFQTERSRVRSGPSLEVVAAQSGYLRRIDARGLAGILHRLGGGRTTAADRIDPDVGIRLLKRSGDSVKAGEKLAIVEGIAGPESQIAASVLSQFEITSSLAAPPEWVLEVRT